MTADLQIVEGVESTWHYHLRRRDELLTLCGLARARYMITLIPLRCWGMKSEHIPESYCKKCTELAPELKKVPK